MPLTMAKNGETVIIQRVGGSTEVKRHLEELGFVPGTKCVVVSSIGGNLILNVKESRIAISKEMAKKIHMDLVA